MQLRPDPEVTPADFQRGQTQLVRDAAFASLTGTLYGGVILVGFALQLGATPAAIGLLSAIPLFAQLAQIPAIGLIERYRQRRKITVIAVTTARLIILSLALIPLVHLMGLAFVLPLAAHMVVVRWRSLKEHWVSVAAVTSAALLLGGRYWAYLAIHDVPSAPAPAGYRG